VVHVRRNRAKHFVLFERVAALHFMAWVAGRELEEEVAQVHAAEDFFRPAGSEVEANAGAVGLRTIRRSRVMDHELELRSGRDPFRRVFGKHVGRAARQERGERAFLESVEIRQVREVRRARVVHNGSVLADARALAFAYQEIAERGHRLDGSRARFSRVADDVDVNVVYYFAITGPDLGGADPLPFLEIRGHDEVLVRVGTGTAYEVFTDVDYDVGFAQPPAFDKDRRRRQGARISLGCATVHPGLNGFDLARGQAGVISECAVMRVGEPGRHLARQHGFSDRLGPGPRGLVVEQRHGGDIVRAMALHAALV